MKAFSSLSVTWQCQSLWQSLTQSWCQAYCSRRSTPKAHCYVSGWSRQCRSSCFSVSSPAWIRLQWWLRSHRSPRCHGHQDVLTVDFENAFNTLDSSEIPFQVRSRLLGLSAFVEFAYGRQIRLLLDDINLNSETGVQQGDPLEPPIFAITLHTRVETLGMEVPGLTINCWYLAAGICAGDEK